MRSHKESPSQTAGPYVHIGCTPAATGISVYESDLGAVMKTGPVLGQEIELTGVVYDGSGEVLRDALVEIWQADAAGLFASDSETRGQSDPNFTGWGRSAGDMETGAFRFETVKPGAVPTAEGALQAPHITVWVVARGINLGLQTRVYFEDEAEANATDPLLNLVKPQSRKQTLIAKQVSAGCYEFNIHLQGADETVFLDI